MAPMPRAETKKSPYRVQVLDRALAALEVLALPMFPELTDAEIRWVVESIADFYS